jgi:class 3 adenylate cyclase
MLTTSRRGATCVRGGLPLPRGVVTFLMTDVAGSTRLWEERPDVAGLTLARHEAVVRAVVHDEGGVLLRSKGEGDSTFSVFADPLAAAAAGARLQGALLRETWPPGAEVRVRAASYTGTTELHGGNYLGAAPCRCARLRDAIHPGQTVCAGQPPAQLAGLSREIVPTDLGYFRLRDIARPVRVFQLDHSELRMVFPPLRAPAWPVRVLEPEQFPT